MNPGPKLDLKKPKYELFEPELQALNAEVIHHPELQAILAQQSNKDIYISISEISSYCGIILDGAYDKKDMLELCEILTKKLYEKRTQIILPVQ